MARKVFVSGVLLEEDVMVFKELNFIAFYVFVSFSQQCKNIWYLPVGGASLISIYLVQFLTSPLIINQKQKLRSQKNN